jgi:hypothetical protein
MDDITDLRSKVRCSCSPLPSQDVPKGSKGIGLPLELLVLLHDDLYKFTRVDVRVPSFLYVNKNLTWNVHFDIRCLSIQFQELLDELLTVNEVSIQACPMHNKAGV